MNYLLRRAGRFEELLEEDDFLAGVFFFAADPDRAPILDSSSFVVCLMRARVASTSSRSFILL